MLIGGDKTGDIRFWDRMIPLADDLYDEHLAELDKKKNDGRSAFLRRTARFHFARGV
jgi:hypothetical protein